MSIIKIAYRNVERQKRRSNLLVGAIAFGVFIIILVNSLTSGIVNNAQKNFTSLLGGHVYITGQEVLESGRVVNKINDTEIIDQVLPGVEEYITGIFKRSNAMGEVIFGSKSTRLSFSGVNWDSEGELLSSLVLIDGSFEQLSDPAAIVLPDSIAEKLGVLVGETVLFRFDTVTGQKNVAEFTVRAVIKDTGSFGISSSYGDIHYFNPLLGLEADEYQNLNLQLNDIKSMEIVSDYLKEKIGEIAPLKVKDDTEEESGGHGGMMSFNITQTSDEVWDGTRFSIKTLNDYMDVIIQLVAILNYIAIGLFIVLLTITMVGLINTFRMILIERTREIGTMRAVGMLRKDIKRIFLLEAIFLSLKGALVGITIAVVVSLIARLITFADDSPLVFFLQKGHISLPLEPLQMMGVVFLLSLITLISAWLPAGNAAKLQPADALRSHA
ncbi:MAG: ABC transporter permease [Spirochaetaceae bacterium]|jgi:putative ABC transport system permease protein|nr:ABC transporter permease [Spirochaetaceae bacterium]